MANAHNGSQISWLLPLAAASLAAGLLVRLGRPRTDAPRAWFVLWGGWLAMHSVVFSLAAGTYHPYYTTAMAPAISALCGPGLVALWGLYQRSWLTAGLLPASLGITALWGLTLLDRIAWLAWLPPAVAVATAVAVTGLLVGRFITPASGGRRLAGAAAALGLAAILAGPAAWASTPLLREANPTSPTAGPPDTSSRDLDRNPGGSGEAPV